MPPLPCFEIMLIFVVDFQLQMFHHAKFRCCGTYRRAPCGVHGIKTNSLLLDGGCLQADRLLILMLCQVKPFLKMSIQRLNLLVNKKANHSE